MIIIVDTNFLMYVAKYRIDLLSELDSLFMKFEVVIPQKVFSELQKLEKSKGMDKFAASLALEIIEKLLSKKKLEIKGIEARNADDEIVKLVEEMQKKEKIKVCTMDRKLADRVKKLGAGMVKIKQKKRISEE